MKVQWYMWVVLALILAPIVQQWIAATYPAAAYPVAGLVVVVIGGIAKWLELILEDNKAKKAVAMLPPGAAAAPMMAAAATQSKMRRLFWDA